MSKSYHSIVRKESIRIAVVMATYNGEGFLGRQIESIMTTGHQAIDLWISDDGSTDGTIDLLKSRKNTWEAGSFHILNGPSQGFAENFRSLMRNPEVEADFIAFCDQDDEWQVDKLDRAIEILSQAGETPAMFCSRTRAIDKDGRAGGMSPLCRKQPQFTNALVENIASGNTMVFNRVAWGLLRESTLQCSFAYHDWWAYILISGAGGLVYYSPEPLVSYRQHALNVIGLNNSFMAKVRRVGALFRGEIAAMNERNVNCLKSNFEILSMENRRTFESFCKLRSLNGVAALRELRRSGIFRQTLYGTIGLYVSGALGRL